MFESFNGDFDIQKSHINGLGDYVITAGLTENGILGKTDVKARIFNENTITIDMFGFAFFRQFKYKIVTHARVFSLNPKFEITTRIGLFLTNALHFLNKKFGYENMCSWNKIESLKISLPVSYPPSPLETRGERKDLLKAPILGVGGNVLSKIDFEFMENFIAELEANRIAELEAYLLATGLKDYNLTSEEEKVLGDFENGKFEWGNFEIEKLFNISRGNISNQKELISYNSGIAFIAQNDNDNGFVDIVKPENHKQFKGNSIIIGRQTGIVYYQEKDFITTDGVLVLSAKEVFIKNRKIGLAFTSSLTKQMFSFSYTNTVSAEKLNKILIQLPTNKNKPDYKIMEIFISAVQKLVIKDVVVYAERKIEGTRKVVGL